MPKSSFFKVVKVHTDGGMLPVNLLYAKLRRVTFLRAEIEEGSGPCSLLPATPKDFNLVYRVKISDGIVPVSLLLLTVNVSSRDKRDNEDGKVDVSVLVSKCRAWSRPNWPILIGSFPCRPIFVKNNLEIRHLFLSTRNLTNV